MRYWVPGVQQSATTSTGVQHQQRKVLGNSLSQNGRFSQITSRTSTKVNLKPKKNKQLCLLLNFPYTSP